MTHLSGALRQLAATYGTLGSLRATPLLTPRQVASNAVLAPPHPAFPLLPIVRLLHASTPFLGTEQDGRYLRLSNLPYRLTDADVWAFCQEYGPVATVHLAKRAADGHPLGWAVVSFKNAEDAQKAASATDGQSLMSRILHADVFENDRSAVPASNFDASTAIYVSELSPECSRQELYSFYSDHGKVKAAYVRTIRKDDQWSTYGYIGFATMGEALAARHATNGTDFMGRPITVSVENPDPYTSPNDVMSSISEVYVENLPASISATQLGDYFLKFGDVVAVYFTKGLRLGNRRHGAFLSFRTAEDAERAAKMANDTLLGDSKIAVNIRHYMRTIPPPDRQTNEVYVGNIPYRLTESEITESFKPFGDVVEVSIPKYEDGTSRGFAFVRFKSYYAAQEAAVKAKDIMFYGRPAIVRIDEKDRHSFRIF